MTQQPDSQVILITVKGEDRPGITATLTGIIAEAGLDILDMEQVVVRTMLSLSILLEFPEGDNRDIPVLKELLFSAKKMGLDLDFQAMEPETDHPPQERSQSVLTLIGDDRVSAKALAHITRVLAEKLFNIETIQRLDQGHIRCLELVVSSDDPKGPRALKTALLPVGREYGVDIALQPNTFFRRVKRLVVFDLDSTLIEGEIIDELAAEAGVAEQVARITAAAMAGELDFGQSLRQRVALLKGLEQQALERVLERVRFAPGAEQLIRVLKRMGYRTAVISGGFTFFTAPIQQRLGLDYAHANQLEMKDGKLTGAVVEPIIDGEAKADLLEQIARAENIRLDQVIAIGDGANDLPMLNRAGLGVAFNAKPAVSAAAQHSLNQRRLDAILFLLGITQRDIGDLERE